MKRLPLLALSFLLLSIAMAACQGNAPAATQPQPTALPAQTEPTSGPTQTATAMPTTRARPTLPPSWTPTATATVSPLPGDVQPTATGPTPTPVKVDGASPVCTNFAPDIATITREFRVGESPSIAWTAVEGAALYRVVVQNEREEIIHERLVTETFYAIPAEVFLSAGRFGWLVEPLDQIGVQMCLGRGEAFTARER